MIVGCTIIATWFGWIHVRIKAARSWSTFLVAATILVTALTTLITAAFVVTPIVTVIIIITHITTIAVIIVSIVVHVTAVAAALILFLNTLWLRFLNIYITTTNVLFWFITCLIGALLILENYETEFTTTIACVIVW